VLLVSCLAVGLTLNTVVVNADNEGVWKRTCVDDAKIETCRITQQLFLSQKDDEGKARVTGRVLGLSVFYVEEGETAKRKPYLSIQMPLGVDLRPGVVLKVDEGKELPLRYLQCTNSGCDTGVEIDSNFLISLKVGQNIIVGFRPWGSDQTVVLKASLSGFAKAFNALK
jgi:invasion protein IalB